MQIKAFPTQLGNLLITDDAVPPQLKLALSELSRQPIWKYGWRSNTRRDRYCYWHAHIAGGDGASRVNCETELAQSTGFSAVYALFKLLQQGPLKGHEPIRAYMNSHTFGVEGYVHQDNKDTENYFSTVYYAHPVWHQNWSGDTVFYTQDESDILTSVFPRPGRAVTFHGAIPHCARAPSRDCNELRVSIVLKTQLVPDEPLQTGQADGSSASLGCSHYSRRVQRRHSSCSAQTRWSKKQRSKEGTKSAMMAVRPHTPKQQTHHYQVVRATGNTAMVYAHRRISSAAG